MSTVATDTFDATELRTLRHDTTKCASQNTAKNTPSQISPGRTLNDGGNGHSFDCTANLSHARSNLTTVLTIFTPCFVGFMSSFTTGIITIGLPKISIALGLDRSLYLWPSSVYGLTSGASLLVAGSIADIVGARPMELVGITFMGVFSLACGLATSGEQLVVFRALQGVALAIHLPASVALIAGAVPSGRARNFGFACLGFSQPLGFAVGLVASGIMVEKAGWRSGFYLTGSATLLAAIAAIWTVPKVNANREDSTGNMITKIRRDIDWVGAFVSSAGLALLAYVLAILSADLTTIRSALTASLLAISLTLLLSFPFWMNCRSRRGKPALVPNRLWANTAFASTCIMVIFSYGAVNAIELFSSLYFQEVQNASPLTTSLYLLPNLATGVIISLLVGTFVHRVPARWLVSGSGLICACSPLLMALLDPAWNYWYLAFWAQVAAPFSADVLFTVGLIIVSDTFSEQTQGLAGAVFNTVAQIGMSLGIGLCQVVALGVQNAGIGSNAELSDGGIKKGSEGHSGDSDDVDSGVLLKGYRASFWTVFAYMAICVVVALIGLRRAGKVGLKRE